MKTRWYIALLALILTACPGTETQAPDTPLGFTGVPTSGTTAQLSWIASNRAVSYALSRSVDGGAFIVVSNPITNTTYPDSGLTAGKTYTYRLIAQNSAGQSSAAQTVVTTPAPIPPISGFSASAVSSTSVNLTWVAVPGASSYRLERKTGSGSYAQIATPSGASYNDTGLTPNTTYTYRLSALQSGTVIAASESNAVTTPPPSPPGNPTNLTFSNVSTTGLTLSWTAPTGGADSYTVERKTGSGSYAQVGAPTGTSFTDSGLSPGVTYTYRVKAVGVGGSSSGVEASQATLSGNFTATALTTKRVQLDWANTPNQARCLYRKQGSGTYGLIVSTQAAWSSYIDTVSTPSQTYTYAITTLSGSCPATPSGGTESTVTLPSTGTPLKVLFIGNSLTFVNSVPQMIQTLANDAGESRAIEFDMAVKSGVSLSEQWLSSGNPPDPNPTARARIQSGPSSGGKWDIVVLQEKSVYPLCVPDANTTSFESNVTNFVNEVKSFNPNAVVVIHTNWVITPTENTYLSSQGCNPISLYTNPVGFTSTIDALERKSFDRADGSAPSTPRAKVAPVGRAWANANSTGIQLLQSGDGIHATPEGSYLAAATYYSLFYNHTPNGLTNNVLAMAPGVTSDPNATLSAANNTVTNTEAQQLQGIAWQTVQNMPAKYRLP